MDGSEVHDIGLSGQDVANQESSWVATILSMDVVKHALHVNVLDAGGFTWQMMVNNGHGSGSALWYRVISGGGCAAQLCAACQPNSMEQVGALNYDLASGSEPNHTMALIDFDEHLSCQLHVDSRPIRVDRVLVDQLQCALRSATAARYRLGRAARTMPGDRRRDRSLYAEMVES